MNQKQYEPSDSKMDVSCSEDEDSMEDQNLDDWDDEDDEQSKNAQLLCLFCDSLYNSCSSLFEHCASDHSFDFYEIRKTLGLDFYRSFKLINYVRSQVSLSRCWNCEKRFQSKEDLLSHFHHEVSFSGGILPWDDDRYLNPFLQDDTLLYSFDEDNECEDDWTMSIDKNELATHLSEFEQISLNDEGCSYLEETKLVSSHENGVKGELIYEGVMNSASPLKRCMENGKSSSSDGMSLYQKTEHKDSVPFSWEIRANEIKKINKNYFGSYSSFVIHRDMISDKIRTDAYRQAIVENPSLLRGAVVMDVGCGTGILSLFAAQAGAARVISVEASAKMAGVASKIAKDNGLLRGAAHDEGSQSSGVIEVIQGMIEELEDASQIMPHSVDVLVSEWMGYCLLYESMLSSVLFARDKWLKPGGAILPDTATMFVAGFGKGGTSLPFWENVYGFDMSCIGMEVVDDASRIPIVDVIDSSNLVTTTKVLQAFDLATMQPNEMDFTARIELEPKTNASSTDHTEDSKLETVWCYGVVLWFETGFTERFCKEKPVVLSTSPYGPTTHWSQTLLTFREPIAMALNGSGEKRACVGTCNCPVAKIQSRISIARAPHHRSIDISLELSGIAHDGLKRDWPVQIFNL